MIPPFVGIEAARDGAPRTVLADVRWYPDGRSEREMYERGHIPGAVFVDLDRCLAGDPGAGRGRHPLPTPEIFAYSMSQLGIDDDSVVVAYDDQGGVVAARLVWMLRATGHEATLLDGGLMAYEGTLETKTVERPRGRFTATPWPSGLIARLDDATDPGNVVIDARNPERYRGDEEPLDPVAGHIPGAVNLPCRQNLDERGRLLPLPVLRERFESLGISAGSPVVSYCGSGVTACHNLLVLEHCGLGSGRLYPGSWSEYSAKPGRPVETGQP